MRDLLRSSIAICAVSLREARRGHGWLALIIVALIMVTAVLTAPAADAGDRMRLAMATVSGIGGFAVIMLALVTGAGWIRSDIEQQTAMVLLSRPLSRVGYLLGRWGGTMIVMIAVLTILEMAGVVAMRLRFGPLPQPVHSVAATSLEVVRGGRPQAIAATAPLAILSGPLAQGHGEALRWHWHNLPDNQDFQLLLRLRLNTHDIGIPVDQSPVIISAGSGDQRRVLTLSPDSPYGDPDDASQAHSGRVYMRSRDERRRDLARDYARLQIPAEMVIDGRLSVQVDRLRSDVRIFAEPHSAALLAVSGGSALVNRLRAALVTLVRAGVLAACGIFLATISTQGVTLLGGFTLLFGGHLMGLIRNEISFAEPGPMVRIMQLLMWFLPDFDRFPVAADLAASQVIASADLLAASLHYGTFTVIFLGAAWLTFRRVEL